MPTLIATLDNNITTFTDDVSDIEATEILESQQNYPPDENLRFLAESVGVFFGIVNNELRFSEIDTPNAWAPENSFKLRENGTGILPISQGILVFTENLTYLLTGTTVDNFRLTTLTDSQGCINGYSCQVIKNIPLWVSYDGICTFQNGRVEVVSKSFLGRLSLDIVDCVVYDEQYVILKADGTLLILDMRYGFRFYTLEFDEPILGVAVDEGNLYFVVDGELKLAFSGDLLPLSYTSPVFVESDYSQMKAYNKVYIRSDGDFNIKMYVDRQLVIDQQISGYLTTELTPLAEKQLGYSYHFEIEGTGTIYAIQTEPTKRQYAS